MRIDGRQRLIEVEARQRIRQIQVRLIKTADGPDILEIAVEHIGEQTPGPDERREDPVAKIIRLGLKKLFFEDRTIEQIDSHRSEVLAISGLESLEGVDGRLFGESRDFFRRIDFENAVARSIFATHRRGRDRHLRAARLVLRDNVAKIHPVELIPTEHERALDAGVVDDVTQVLSHGVGRALLPIL